jgi:spermidine/putrescine transport system substrate-binding protein
MTKLLKIFLILLWANIGFCQKYLRIAAWGGEIPPKLIHQFEQKTGIKVYITTVESNESLIIKLKTSRQSVYDIIAPSNYYISLLNQLNIIQELDPKKIPELKNINQRFIKTGQSLYTVPFIYGASGIFYNKKWIKKIPSHWIDFWSPEYRDQLLLLDDTREVFSLGLLSQNLSPNSQNPKDIHQTYKHLLTLTPNIKLFASDAVPRIITDEDANIGIAWNGDVVRAQQENKNLEFVYPSEGYILWSEGFSITSHAKNIDEAYAFINFILTPKNLAQITKKYGFSVTNEKAKEFLPKNLVENSILFPNQETLNQGILQEPLNAESLKLYNQYWEKFKLSI